MMKFDVPFIPDADYTSFLSEQANRLSSLYFSLSSPLVPDARHRFDVWTLDQLIDALVQVKGPGKYLLMNSLFHAPDDYFDKRRLKSISTDLERMIEADVLSGIVFVDAYHLQALSDFSPGLTASLEAVPGVNLAINSLGRLLSFLDIIDDTHFKPPTRIVLDRALNRRLASLTDLSIHLQQAFPGLTLSLLANEGCLYECPFKPAHDAQIAYNHLHPETIRTQEINRDFGCRRLLENDPVRLFSSPLIRPEDVRRYAGLAHAVKISGRSLGPKFLTNTVRAYLDGNYPGNLLDLTDAMNWLAERLHVANDRFPDTFFDTLSTCGQACGRCSYCETLFSELVRKNEMVLPDIRA